MDELKETLQRIKQWLQLDEVSSLKVVNMRLLRGNYSGVIYIKGLFITSVN
jgi:hypothetical protein